MIDFRYHIVSIVAIFFALGAGVVLGAGPLKGTGTQLVQDQALKDRKDLVQAREELIQAKALDKYRDDYVSKVTAGLTDGKLTGKNVAVVTMPDVDGDLANNTVETLEKAGAQVTTRVSLDAKLFQADQRQLIDQLTTELVTADVTFTKDSTTFERTGQILGRAIAANAEGKNVDGDATKILGGLTGSKLFGLKPTPKQRASLIVVIAGKTPNPAPDTSSYSDAVDLAEGLDRASSGVVVAGTPESAQNGGYLKSLRGDSDAAKAVSSVDVANMPSGRATIVFALVEQAEGKAGQYGGVDAKNGVAPSAAQAKDN
ncbi:copper transporter [Kribbella deserti]|uniref:Copper transporter n=1 Tax=Kribbella deserti TaxID=1926257 RepID=A0ABV6QRW4_9ACTN